MVHPTKVIYRQRKSHLALIAMLVGIVHGSGSAAAPTRVFYDGSESGNTNTWDQDGGRNRCQSVTSSADGIAGPYAGSRMIRCNWNGQVEWSTPTSYETLVTKQTPFTSELFYRVRFRIDKNLAHSTRTAPDPDPGSPTRPKILRIFVQQSPGDLDIYSAPYDRVTNACTMSNDACETWWGNTTTTDGVPERWHMMEYYFNHAQGTIRVWIDDVQVRNDTLNFGQTKWVPLRLASNWSGADGCCTHDTTNYAYFDEIEVYSDATSGTPATGSMQNGDIRVGAATGTAPQAPGNLVVRP